MPIAWGKQQVLKNSSLELECVYILKANDYHLFKEKLFLLPWRQFCVEVYSSDTQKLLPTEVVL